MHTFVLGFLVQCIVLILAGCATKPVSLNVERMPKPTRSIQESNAEDFRSLGTTCSKAWQAMIFPALDKSLASVGLNPLSREISENSGLNVRVWVGFGNKSLRGFVLRQTGDKTYKAYLLDEAGLNKGSISQKELSTPRNGWDRFISSIQASDLINLSDECELQVEPLGIEDSDSVVVETRVGPNYKAVMYERPGLSRSKEGEKILQLSRFIEKEFNILLLPLNES